MKSVMIVDDDQDIREALQAILELEGYVVMTAANGKEAVTAMRGGFPCLILLDLMMPVMDGWQFLARRKQDAHLARIPVVVVTAAMERVRPSGATELVRKPVDLDALLETIRRYCA